MAEDAEFKNYNDIKMEIDSDEEDFIVYNILEETEDIILDKNEDPLLYLTPIVYTTKLDDMKTIKQDLTTMNAKEILRKMHSESKPVVRSDSINLSSNSPNVVSFVKLADVINDINCKAKPQISTKAGIPPNSFAYFDKNVWDSENKVVIDELTSVVSDIDFEEKPQLSTNAGIPSNLYAYSDTDKQESTWNSKNIDLNVASVNFCSASDIHFKEKPQISTNAPTAPYFDSAIAVSAADSAIEINIDNTERYRPCYVVLEDIKKLIPANRTVKLDSRDRIIREVQVKVEETSDSKDNIEIFSSKPQINRIINTIGVEESVIKSKESSNNNMNSSPEESQTQNTDLLETPAEQQASNDICAKKSTYDKPKRKRKARIIYETSASSSDEDYVPVVNVTKKHKIYKLGSNSLSNSISKMVPNTVSNNPSSSVSKMVPNTVSNNPSSSVSKRVPNTASLNPSNSVSKIIPVSNTASNNVSNTTSVTIVGSEMTLLSFQEKYALIVLTHKKKKAFVYRVNSSKLVTDYYITKDFDEYRLASMYPKEEKIIEQYCCWYKREEIVGKICSRKNYPYTIQKFLKQPHTCHPEECQCCCHTINVHNSQAKQKERRALINKSLKAADDWIRELLNKSTTDGLVSKALTYTPKAVLDKPNEIQSEKYLENYLLCIRNSSPNLEFELYEIGQNGVVIRSMILHNGEEVKQLRRTYQLMSMPIRDASLCCWFKREKLIKELKTIKTAPATLKHVLKPHSCKRQKCLCCCKPLALTLRAVEPLPSNFKQTTSFEKHVRSVRIQFSAKSKSAMSKASGIYPKSKKIAKSTDASAAAVVLSNCATKDDNPDLSINILRKFKNLKLGVNCVGKIEVVLNEPAKNLSVAELKVLSDILVLSTKQITELGLSAEEFCDRINSKSGDVIHVTAPETTLLICTEQMASLHQDDDDIEMIDVEDDDVILEDDTISSNQTTLTGGTETITTQYVLKETNPIEPPKKPLNNVKTIYKSLSNLMETKNKSFVDSFKSFFNKYQPTNTALPSSKKLKHVSMPEAVTVKEEIPYSMPIIQETFTLATSPTDVSIDIPGPSCVKRQRETNMASAVAGISGNNMNTQVDKKIRVKLPSELNAPMLQNSPSSVNSHSDPITAWPGPIVIKQEPQTNIQQIVQSVDSSAVTSPNAQNQTFLVSSNIMAPNLRIVSPTLTVNNVFHMNGNIKVQSANANSKGIRYLTLAPLKGSNTDDSKKAIIDNILGGQQPTASSSGICQVPPLVPIRNTHDQNQDIESSITYNVISNIKL